MLRTLVTSAHLSLSLALLLGVNSAAAQLALIDNTTSFVRITSQLDEKLGSISAGSISGRVFNDAAQTEESLISEGIAGVRIILRSKEGIVDAIVGNRISDAAGRFDFDVLPPGKYSVEVDSISMPSKYRVQVSTLTAIDVQPARRSNVELPVAARRQIVGIVFIDNDGNGRYKPGMDEPVRGAYISVVGQLAVSNADGGYILSDLPAGRIGMLVTWPKKNENTHVVLYLPPGPVTNRIVNISRDR